MVNRSEGNICIVVLGVDLQVEGGFSLFNPVPCPVEVEIWPFSPREAENLFVELHRPFEVLGIDRNVLECKHGSFLSVIQLIFFHLVIG